MKSVKVILNGKPLREIYPHANGWQVFKWKVRKFFRKVFILAIVVGAIYLTYTLVIGVNKPKDTSTESPVIQKQVDDELERIMNEENFKKVTILRARKVASDSKMAEENTKYEDIIKAEKARHEAILAQIEAENEAIRAEELALVGKTNLK